MGNLGNLFRVISKYTYSRAVSIGDPVAKIGKEELFLLSWAVRLDNKLCEKSKRDKGSRKGKGYH